MKLAIIDCGSGNLRSIAKACEKVAQDRHGGRYQLRVGRTPSLVAWADRIILPGVGAFAHCRGQIDDAMAQALERHVLRAGKPFLGICIGMQILADAGFEHATTAGLGWIGGNVVPLFDAPLFDKPLFDKKAPSDSAPRSDQAPSDSVPRSSQGLKTPHMGWNEVIWRRSHPLWPEGGQEGERAHFYFLHSYRFASTQESDVVADTDYGGDVPACIARDNIAGVQFHPEKSQKAGLQLLSHFMDWQPC